VQELANTIWQLHLQFILNFLAFSVYFVDGRFKPSMFTFGGDRETFDPSDYLGFQKVDNDVWRLSPEWKSIPEFRMFPGVWSIETVAIWESANGRFEKPMKPISTSAYENIDPQTR